jgi:HTH-type transcriptional regulator, competence development regulator
MRPESNGLTFGARLKQLRRERRLTQRQLSESAGVDFTYLSKIENDRVPYSPSIRTLQALARALNIDELTLMDWANKVPPMLESFAGNPEAMRFLRRAADTAKSPLDWKRLMDLLDSEGENK